jgi:hypothetical protein
VPPLALKLKPGYAWVTLPVGGLADAMTIADSLIWRLTDSLAASGGMEESVTVTETGYVPAAAGVPNNSPEALSVRPGGREPDSLQRKGGVPPEAVNV